MDFKISEELLSGVEKCAYTMQQNAMDKNTWIDYKSVQDACKVGSIPSDNITEATIKLIQDIRVLMTFVKEDFFTKGLTCSYCKDSLYQFTDITGAIIEIHYNVLKNAKPKIYAVIADYTGKIQRKRKADTLHSAWKMAKHIDVKLK